jgi:hypothetical protein
MEDKIIPTDLANIYFEGEKRSSKLTKFGKSKEKRSNTKLMILAWVVNPEEFLKYSNVFEKNTTDCNTLPAIIDNLIIKTNRSSTRAIIIFANPGWVSTLVKVF